MVAAVQLTQSRPSAEDAKGAPLADIQSALG
jgi:hypothetical protein